MPSAFSIWKMWNPFYGEVMKTILTLMCFGLALPMAHAQETNPVDELRRQLQQLRENFEKIQREQQVQIESLTRKIDDLTAPQAKAAQQKELEQELTAQLGTNQPAATAPASPSWTPSQPITVARAGSAYMNISFDVLMDAGWSTAHDPSQFLQLGDHDPSKTDSRCAMRKSWWMARWIRISRASATSCSSSTTTTKPKSNWRKPIFRR